MSRFGWREATTGNMSVSAGYVSYSYSPTFAGRITLLAEPTFAGRITLLAEPTFAGRVTSLAEPTFCLSCQRFTSDPFYPGQVLSI